jgi:hypothetical protein
MIHFFVKTLDPFFNIVCECDSAFNFYDPVCLSLFLSVGRLKCAPGVRHLRRDLSSGRNRGDEFTCHDESEKLEQPRAETVAPGRWARRWRQQQPCRAGQMRVLSSGSSVLYTVLIWIITILAVLDKPGLSGKNGIPGEKKARWPRMIGWPCLARTPNVLYKLTDVRSSGVASELGGGQRWPAVARAMHLCRWPSLIVD